MSKRSPKIQGTEWLYLSMASFNGSGYADKSSPEHYYQSYVLYSAWKNRPNAVRLAKLYELEALSFSEKLCVAADPGHTPSEKNINNFAAFCNRVSLL